MTTPTLARDAAGDVMLTTEQAAALARSAVTWDYEPVADLRETIIYTGGGNPNDTLARWVLRWAPVVSAAEALEGTADGFADLSPWSADDAVPKGWDAAVDKVVAAVRAARVASVACACGAGGGE